MIKIKCTELLIFILSAELTGALSALFAGDFSARYETITKPPLSPPGALFPVVWTILYALMGISAYIIWQRSGQISGEKKLYIVQLAVNFLWSILFFRFGLLGFSAICAILLLVLVFAMIKGFGKISTSAAYINIPYLLWSAFAAYLSIGIWALNR